MATKGVEMSKDDTLLYLSQVRDLPHADKETALYRLFEEGDREVIEIVKCTMHIVAYDTP